MDSGGAPDSQSDPDSPAPPSCQPAVTQRAPPEIMGQRTRMVLGGRMAVSRTGWLMPLKSLEGHRPAGTHQHLVCQVPLGVVTQE